MRVLIATKIFPSERNPNMAPFNRHQFVALSKLCEVDLVVCHPWFPGESIVNRVRHGEALPDITARASVDGFSYVQHRVFHVPKIGHPFSGLTYATSLLPSALRLRGKVDAVLGAFAYPDGFAAVLLAKALGVPATIKVHGTDINLLGSMPTLRPLVSWALREADAVIGPSQALIDRAIELGADPKTSQCIMNGVDKELFQPRDREACRRELGIASSKPWVVFIGLMIDRKGGRDAIAAFRQLHQRRQDVELIMLGDGPALEAYRAEARDLPVHFPGRLDHEAIPTWIGASDVVTLPSWAEGTPNVIIESLVSGRPVVASDVGGIPALLNHPTLGECVPARDPKSLAEALERVLRRNHDALAIAKQAGFSDWRESAQRVLDVLNASIATAAAQ